MEDRDIVAIDERLDSLAVGHIAGDQTHPTVQAGRRRVGHGSVEKHDLVYGLDISRRPAEPGKPYKAARQSLTEKPGPAGDDDLHGDGAQPP